jgi:predicted dithiol-disulfide oxidoreductase (DUF899 family)
MTEAETLEAEIMEKASRLARLRAAEPAVEVKDYEFQTLNGPARLSALFADRDRLLMIHNMGGGCRYCTTWADGINGVLRHLEEAMAVVLVSKDPPDVQRRLAEDRGWRMRMASHGGGPYMTEQSIGEGNYPGAVVYELEGGKILRRGRAPFGPGDLYSPLWHFLALAGVPAEEFTPQFHYWRRPQKMDDGGENLKD